jgi:hypothetical protein
LLLQFRTGLLRIDGRGGGHGPILHCRGRASVDTTAAG